MFDAIYVLHCIRHNYRVPALEAEFRRVGLRDLGDVRYSANGNYAENTLSILESAIANREYRILILENDVRFRKDFKRSFGIMRGGIESEYDLVSFDNFFNGDEEWCKHFKCQGKEYVDREKYVYGASCYTLNRKAICVLRDEYKANLDKLPDEYCFMMNPRLRCGISVEHATVQVSYCDSNKVKCNNPCHRQYEVYGVDYKDFAVPEGYVFGSVVNEIGEVLFRG